jgi:hypothetical protein
MKQTSRMTGSKFPLPVIALGLVLVIAAAVIAFAQNLGGGAPRLVVDPPEISYGDVRLGTELTFEIKVKNEGNAPLRFRDQPSIEVLEGC